MKFILKTDLKPKGDQAQAIKLLAGGYLNNKKHQVLLGITGSGKTFTMANVIASLQKPALVISHNKTLAAQLYQEFRDLFPDNAVSYFVSYYDFYQPEAYIPQTDTYIEKEAQINEEIDKLRLAATTNILTRADTIIVASVSCIYNLGSPQEYQRNILTLSANIGLTRQNILKRLVELQYHKNNYDFKRGTFRVLGEVIDIYLAYEDTGIRIIFENEKLQRIKIIDPLSGKEGKQLDITVIYPAKHYIMDSKKIKGTFLEIRKDLEIRIKELHKQNKLIEAERLRKRVNYDLEMIEEIGYVNGIENYSRYFDCRNPGDPPYTLINYFKEKYHDDWLLFIDESHMTVPQIGGMYNGDRSRKKTLIDFGFRLPSAFDNRPLTFAEFSRRTPKTIYVSATPALYELSLAKEQGQVVEQLIRPTGILDPKIFVRSTQDQIIDLVLEILGRINQGERVLITTLTKRMAEDLSSYLNEKKYLHNQRFKNLQITAYPKVHYLHADIKTLERSDILDDLRMGKYDVIIGINLLREGLDLPEVSLVAILDADKEGFLRSTTSLIQTMGRAARHINGTVIMYADNITNSMKIAIEEIERRRKIQLEYNRKFHIIPKSISKPIREKLVDRSKAEPENIISYLDTKKRLEYRNLLTIDTLQLTPGDIVNLIKKLEREMKRASDSFDFELAAEIRDKIRSLQKTVN